MTTAADVLAFEGLRLGHGGDETWEWADVPAGTAWCAFFQSMSLTACGLPIRFGWVSAMFDHYRGEGRTTTDIRSAEPGDLVGFEWGATPGGMDHVAMVIAPTASGLWTRNGNVNGSRVADLWFPYDGGGMVELARPPYTSPDTPEEGDDEMGHLILWDPRNGRGWHAYGNTKVYLSTPAQVAALKFLGAQEVPNCSPDYIDALATIPRDGGWLRPDTPTPPA